MKEKRRLGLLFQGGGAPWLFAAFLALNWLGTLLKTVLMALTRHRLPLAADLGANFLAAVAGWLLFVAAAQKLANGNLGSTLSALPGAAGPGLWLATLGIGAALALDQYVLWGAVIAFSKPALYLLLYIALAALFCLLASPLLLALIYRGGGVAAGPKQLLKRPLLVLYGAFAIGVGQLAPYAVGFLLGLLPPLFDSVFTDFVAMAAGAALWALLLLPLMRWALVPGPKAAVSPSDPAPAEPAPASVPAAAPAPVAAPAAAAPVSAAPAGVSGKARKKPSLLSASSALSGLVALAAALAASVVLSAPLSAMGNVENEISALVSKSLLYGADGDLLAAARYAEIAQAHLDAWRGAVLGQGDLLARAAKSEPTEEQVQLLSLLHASVNPTPALEAALLDERELSDEWLLTLLDSYSGRTLNPEETLRRDEVRRLCLRNGTFVNTAIFPDAFAGKEKAFETMLAAQEERLAGCMGYVLLAKAAVLGPGQELVTQAVALAEAYPGQADVQLMALSFGCEYLYDGGRHYDATAQAGLRYLALYEAEGHTPEEMANPAVAVAGKLLLLGKADKALSVVEPYIDTREDAAGLYLSCLYRDKLYARCQETAREALKRWPENTQIAYQLGLCALENKDLDAYAEAALALSAALQKATDAELLQAADNMLYILLERICLSDTATQTRYVGDLTQAQRAKLTADPFLNDYFTAVAEWADRHYDNGLAAIDRVLAAKDGLPFALYHRGILLYQRGEGDDVAGAKAAFTASLALDDGQPTVWYMLACACDRLGEYREAYSACLRVDALAPDTDHNLDIYGVSVHANSLRVQLEKKLKEGN